MTYKHPIGFVASTSKKCTVFFDHYFKPDGVVTKTQQGSEFFDSDIPMLIVEHGTAPGNSGSMMKAYAVMVPDGLIGYIFESSLKKV
jgi:hypothetical protein